jgi:hypothetical protein
MHGDYNVKIQFLLVKGQTFVKFLTKGVKLLPGMTMTTTAGIRRVSGRTTRQQSSKHNLKPIYN